MHSCRLKCVQNVAFFAAQKAFIAPAVRHLRAQRVWTFNGIVTDKNNCEYTDTSWPRIAHAGAKRGGQQQPQDRLLAFVVHSKNVSTF